MIAIAPYIFLANEGSEGIAFIFSLPFPEKFGGENVRLFETVCFWFIVQEAMGKYDLIEQAPFPFIIGASTVW